MVDSFTASNHPAGSSADRVGTDVETDAHFTNLIQSIRNGGQAALRQPISSGNISTTLVQLANISYFTQRALMLDGAGHITGDKEAEAMTRRTYQTGWEPRVV